MWLHQVNYGPGSTDGEKYGGSNFPSQIMLNGRKTWSANRLMTWMAIDANSVSANGHIIGDGSNHIDRSESPDVLDSLKLEKGPIEWPLIGQNIIFEDDFSSDSGWITSTPSNFVRDASENNLHWNINECSLKYYQAINPLADDFNLSVDMIFDAELGNTPIDVGLYEDINYYSPLDTSNLDIRFGQFCNQFMVTIRGTYANGQRFDYPCLDCACTGLHVGLEYGKWYTVKLGKAGSKWELSVYNKSDNNLVGTASGPLAGEFNAFKYIYIGDLLCGGQENANGRLDNIKLEAASVSTASISGRAWNDTDNNGFQDPLEVGLSAITVNLYTLGATNPISTTTTDTSGKYSFRGLHSGNYFVEFISPVNYIFSPKDLGGDDAIDSDVEPNNGRTDVITIISGQNKMDIDAGLHSKTSNQLSISGLAWDDTNFDGIQNPGEIGIEDVVVNLHKAGEKVRIKFNITNSTGYYKIENIDPGYYEVKFIKPDDYVFSPKDQGGDDSKDSDVNIDSGRTNPFTVDQESDTIKWDAGLHKNRSPEIPHRPVIKQTGVVGETIAVKTWAVDPDGDKVRFKVNWGHDSVDEDTEYVDSGQSAYLYHTFHEARSNKYLVKAKAYDTNGASSDWSKYGEIKISSGAIPHSSIGDFVWNDWNRNGIQDPGETGIGGVTLNLYKDGETKLFKTTTTTSEGYYFFRDLDTGSYWIEVKEPSSNYVFSPQLGGYPEKGSDVNPSSKRMGIIYCAGQEDMNYDAGMFSTSTYSSINGLVWNDINKNGILESSENGIKDVEVQLFKSGKSLKSVFTNINGYYTFSDLDEGYYYIGFNFPSPSGYTFSPVHSRDTDITRDSDVNTGSGRTDEFYLEHGQTKKDIDAGMYQIAGTDPLGNLRIILAHSTNVKVGERVPISIMTLINRNLVAADIELKIKNDIVAQVKSSDYTYQLETPYVGKYEIDVTATYNGDTVRTAGVVEATGDTSRAIKLAMDVLSYAYMEIYKSEDKAVTRLIKSEKEAMLIELEKFFALFFKGSVKALVKKCIPEAVYSQLLDDYIEGLEYFTLKAYKTAFGTVGSALIDILTSDAYAKELHIQRLESYTSIKDDKAKIDKEYRDFVSFINSNPKSFANYKSYLVTKSDGKLVKIYMPELFELYSKPIREVVDSKPIFPSTYEIGATESQLAEFYDNTNWLTDVVKVALLSTIVLLIVIATIFFVVYGSPIVLPTLQATIFAYAGLALGAIEAFWSQISALLVGGAIIKFTFAVLLIMIVPAVTNLVEDQHSSSIVSIESAAISQEMPNLLYINAYDTTSNIAAEITSNGDTFVVTPDGRVSELIVNKGNYDAIYPGNYTVMSYQHAGTPFSSTASTHFRVKRPNVTHNVSYNTQNTRTSIHLSVTNHELARQENLKTIFSIKNSTENTILSKAESISLNSGETKTFSYDVDLKDPDIYTATSILSIGFLESIQEKVFSIPIGSKTTEDAGILNISYQNEYSPHDNVSMNVTVESYAPELSLNISVPRLDYSESIILTGTKIINLTLPKLQPDHYFLRINVEKDGRVLDSKMIGFYVRADGTGLLTFNTGRLIYTAVESTPINISLRDLNLNTIYAAVGVTIIDPLGGVHDYAATKIPDGYQLMFSPAINGTYRLEVHAAKEGYRIDNNTLDVIVGEMSQIRMDVVKEDYIAAKVTANGVPTTCKVTMYTDKGNTSIITPNGIAIFNPEESFCLVADKTFFKPAIYSQVEGCLDVENDANPKSSTPGSKVNFKIVIANTGNYSFNQVSAADYLPSGFEYVSDNRSGSVSERVISWNNLGPLPVGESIAIHLVARIEKGATGDLRNAVNAMGIAPLDEGEKVGSAASAESRVRVLVPEVKVEKTLGIPETVQYGQFCENQKVTGTGKVDISTSVVDKKLALQYLNSMAGNGDIELKSESAVSEKSSKIMRDLGNSSTPLNLYESTTMSYSGDTPLTGKKDIESNAFYDGIGANIQEVFSVFQMEKDQQTFFASTDPASNACDQNEIEQLRNASATHLVGMNSNNSFNGTWGTDSSLHKPFYKDILAHQSFAGRFEIQKLIKFHENPVNEPPASSCEGLDC